MSVYGNTNSRVKARRTTNCQTFCFSCPALRPAPTPINNHIPKSILFPDQSFLQMNSGIVFGGITQPFTIETWFRSTYAVNGDAVLLGSGGTGTNGAAPFADSGLSLFNNTATEWKVDSSGKGNQAYTLQPTAANTWYYLAVSRDANSYMQMWMGALGDATATASSTGRQLLTDTNIWNFSSPTLQIGAWVNTTRYNNGLYINQMRITNTNLFATTAANIYIPTTEFTNVAGTQLLLNATNNTIADQTGNQTFTNVGTPSTFTISPFVS